MYLQKLAIQGFKSFANKTALDFKPGVTAIVGPNGSGKSNIADAVRWVLGEQSLKTLRGKKSGDVIFAGSDKKTRLGYCQVDLHLNNEDHKAPVDFSEIVISRKIFRDGEGEYFINKTRVRLQDVLMLLAKSNFGQRSYSIIGQGMVDMFLSVSPTVRKEYFDEAAGVRQFQIKKEQAEGKLRLTKENLAQAELLIREIAPRLRSLTRQVNRLQRREEVTKELKGIQHQYYAGFWHDLKAKHRAEEQNCRQIEAKQKTATGELESIQKKMQQLAVGSSRQDEFQKLQHEYDQVNAEKNKLLREQAELKGQIDADRQQKGATDIVWLERKKEQLENELKNLNSQLNELKQEVDKYSAQLKDKEKEQSAILHQHQDISKKLVQAREKLAHKKSITLPEIAKDLEVIYNHQKSLLEKIENAQTPEDLRPLKAEAKTVTSNLAQLSHKLKESGEGDPHEIIALQDQISKLLKSKGELSDTINDIKIKLQVSQEKENINQKSKSQLSEELNKINRELSNASADKSAQQLAQDLQQEKSELDKKIEQTEQQLKSINDKLSSFNLEEQKKKEEVFALQNTFSKKQDELNKISSQLNAVKIELAKLETRQEDLEKEMVDELNDEERNLVYKTDKPPEADQSLFTEIQKLKRQLELIGGIDPQVSQEYKETKERHDFLTHQSEDLNKAINDLEKAIINLNETIKKQFNQAFDQINKQFTQYFKILFNGGNASLSLVKEEIKKDDEEDEDEKKEQIKKVAAKNKSIEKVVTGIDIHATPPGKKLKGISMLSGGERALTSIALICAIIHHNPSPFVILDEVDAALDESNSIRFASIIDRLSKKTQFILVTHNRATMNQAHTLYGVTMGDDGVSKLLSVNMEEAERVINNQ